MFVNSVVAFGLSCGRALVELAWLVFAIALFVAGLLMLLDLSLVITPLLNFITLVISRLLLFCLCLCYLFLLCAQGQ